MNNGCVQRVQTSDSLPHLYAYHLCSSALLQVGAVVPDFCPHEPITLFLALGWTESLAGDRLGTA